MKIIDVLKTANAEWGFWGTSVRNGYDAEDVLQAVFVRIWEAEPEYRPMG